jgi:hypothetical protein
VLDTIGHREWSELTEELGDFTLLQSPSGSRTLKSKLLKWTGTPTVHDSAPCSLCDCEF